MTRTARLGAFRLCLLVVGVAACSATARADDDGKPELRYSVTPFVGWRAGGDFDFESSELRADVNSHVSGALSMTMSIDEISAYEVFYSSQKSSLSGDVPLKGESIDVQYLHFGGTLITLEDEWLKPYIAGGLGITRMHVRAPESNDDSNFSISFAAGLYLPVTPRFDVRIEARAYFTFLSSESSIFCGFGEVGGACALRSSGTVFDQYDILAGATFRF
jgi:hypothetical protein